MTLVQTKVRFLGNGIHQRTIKPIARAIEFAEKYTDEIKVKTQLERFWDIEIMLHISFQNYVNFVLLSTKGCKTILMHGRPNILIISV